MSTKMGASVSYSNGPPNFADARAVQLIATHSVISSDRTPDEEHVYVPD
jgi:hypothetical protein